MTRRTQAGLGLAVAAAGALAFAVWRRLPAEPRYDYAPIARSSALQAWPASPPEAEAKAAATAPRRWLVMGWDGADWSLVLPLLQQGRLPHLARLMREGASGEMRTFVPTLSAALWTSVATGVTPRRHGIEGFSKPPQGLAERLQAAFGKKLPVRLYSNADRRRPALWNVASAHGRKVLVVGYHNTFPAEKVQGVMVSNYLVRQEHVAARTGAQAEDARTVAAHAVFPPQLLKRVVALQRQLDDLPHAELRRFADLDAASFAEKMKARTRGGRGTGRWDYLLKAYAYDEFHGRVALLLRDEVNADFTLVHFQSPDWAGHYFLYHHAPELFRSLPGAEALERRLGRERRIYAGTLAAFYEYADEWLGRLREGLDPSVGILVLSDHGMEARANVEEPGFHNDGPPGLFVMAGPGVRPGQRVAGASLYDVLPTLLASSGLPVARDLEGRVLSEAFLPGLVDEDRVVRVDSYGEGAFVPDVPLEAEFQQDMEEELRGLGYIQ